MAYKSKADQAAAARRHYQANRDKMIARAAESAKRAREAARAFVAELKSAPCADCGQTFPPYVMDFDHLRDKVENIGTCVSRGWPIARIAAEVAKCEIVCANCHRIRTHTRNSDC